MRTVKLFLTTSLAICLFAGVGASLLWGFPGPYFHYESKNLEKEEPENKANVALLKAFSITSKVGSVTVEVSCSTLTSGEASVFNAPLQGQGESKSFTFGTCTVPTPAGCKVHNGGFAFSNIRMGLGYVTSPTQEEVNKKTITTKILYYLANTNAGEEFGKVEIEKCNPPNEGVNGTYVVKGNFAGTLASERKEVAKDGITIDSTIIKRFVTIETKNCNNEDILVIDELPVNGVTFGGVAATLKGEFSLELASTKQHGEWDEKL
jgi:hypothetical protein